MTWLIDKQFDFCYGHRVWSQKLIGNYCESGDASCKCKHLHGHQGKVHVFLEADELERGMVTDFKHLGWLKNFIDDTLDHKFIIDLHDPLFSKIMDADPIYDPLSKEFVWVRPHTQLETSKEKDLIVANVYVPETNIPVGWVINVDNLSGTEKEFLEGFFIINVVPTSENLSKWIFDCVNAKMSIIGIKTTRIDWFETPKSRSSYYVK